MRASAPKQQHDQIYLLCEAAASAFRKSCDDVSEGSSLDTRTTYIELRLVCHIKSIFST